MSAPSRWSLRLATLAHYFRGGKLFRYVVARVLAATGTSSWLTIPQNGYRLRFYPSAMSIALWTAPSDRHGDEQFFRQYLRPGDTAIDVGANIGQLSVVASLAVGPTGRVIAVEPHPRIVTYLRGNLALNNVSNVATHNVALGDASGTITFSDARSDDQNAVVRDGAGVQVPIVRLDDLQLPAGPIALLKVDVEGYEELVFRGGSDVLRRTSCVLFESWEAHCERYGRRSSTVVDLMLDAGFMVFRLADGGELIEAPRGHVSLGCENLVAVKDRTAFFDRWNGHPR